MTPYYKQVRPLSGWRFQDCSGWRILQDIWRGRFLGAGILPPRRFR